MAAPAGSVRFDGSRFRRPATLVTGLGRVDRAGRTSERRALVLARAKGHDLAVVLVDDPMRDRKAEAGPLTRAPLGEEGLEDVFEDLGAQSPASASSVKTISAIPWLERASTRNVPFTSIDSSALTIKFNTTCLISCVST